MPGQVYPTLKAEERPLEIVQGPGDTIFVPGGWWHLVLNLEDSVAVTQNFVSVECIPRVIHTLACGSAAELCSGDPTVTHCLQYFMHLIFNKCFRAFACPTLVYRCPAAFVIFS